MQHIRVILHLFLFPIMGIYQNKELADNFETILFFLSNIQSMACNACTLNNETLQLYTKHFLLQIVCDGKLFTEGVGNVIQGFLFRFVQCETYHMRRTVE